MIPASAPQKTFSQQETFSEDVTDEEYVEAVLRRMAEAAYQEKEIEYPVMAGLSHFTTRDGSGHKVTSSYAQNASNSVTLAAQGVGNLFVLQAGLQNTPYQGFPNQQMDMVGNHSEFLNFHYRRDFRWGVLDTREIYFLVPPAAPILE